MLKKAITFFILCSALFTLSSPFTAHAATIQLPQTGQTKCYDAALTEIACPTTGQDADKKAGVAWPNPRFADNNDGTITDNLTGLIWLKNAGCFDTVGSITKGTDAATSCLTWPNALTWSNTLASGDCGLSDGSTAGQWRLPNINELESLIDLSRSNPALPVGHPFTNVQALFNWSSSSHAFNTNYAWVVSMYDGYVSIDDKVNINYVWPVRAAR